VKVQQRVTVTVMEIDLERKRVALSMKSKPDLAPRSTGGGARPGGGAGSSRPAQGRITGGGGNDWFTAAMNKGGKK